MKIEELFIIALATYIGAEAGGGMGALFGMAGGYLLAKNLPKIEEFLRARKFI